MTELSKKDLFVAIEHGHAWHTERIKGELEKIIATNPNSYHELRWDKNEKLYFLWDDDCNLFVEDGLISTRSDKDNVFSTDVTVKFPINSVDDIKAAYAKFNSMTMEGEDE